MTKKGVLVGTVPEFDYHRLEADVAARVRASTARIQARLQKTLADLVSIGNELQAIKEALEQGQFGRWLKAEFGWTDRTARHYMAVARQFGQTEIISETSITPTAAFLLAARSVPDEARQEAIQLAQDGQPLTVKRAKEIVTALPQAFAAEQEDVAAGSVHAAPFHSPGPAEGELGPGGTGGARPTTPCVRRRGRGRSQGQGETSLTGEQGRHHQTRRLRVSQFPSALASYADIDDEIPINLDGITKHIRVE